MRAFLALEIEDSVIGEIIKVQEELRSTGADLKLVERENLHFTVKFFGEITKQQIDEIEKRVSGLDLRSLEVYVNGLGTFPHIMNPRVIWVGVRQSEQSKMIELAESVIKALEGIGEPEERRYHPHVTLGRARSNRNREILVRYVKQNEGREFGISKVKFMKLKSSILTPKGPIYSDLKSYVLK
jgi:2'-5' RNA ligase